MSDSPDAGIDGDRWWRLVSANQRELGRSIASMPSGAIQDVLDELVSKAEELDFSLVSSRARSWTWIATLDEIEVAKSARAYDRRRDALENCNQFRKALSSAHLLGEATVRGRGRSRTPRTAQPGARSERDPREGSASERTRERGGQPPGRAHRTASA